MKKSYIYILAAAFLFSTMEVALKLAGVTFNAMQLTFLRFLIGGVCLLPFAMYDLKKRQYKLIPSDWLYLFFLGFLCICISMVLFQLGVMRINANFAAIIISTNPVFTMIFAQFVANEKFTAKKAGILILNIIALIIVANPFTVLKGEISVNGMLLTLAAAISFGLYTALGKKRISRIGGLAQNSFSFLLGSFVLLIALFITNQPIVTGIELPDLPLLFYIGVFVTGVGYYCYIKAIELLGPSTASITFFVKPIFAPFIAFLVLKEPITANIVCGVILILAGPWIIMTGDRIRFKLLPLIRNHKSNTGG